MNTSNGTISVALNDADVERIAMRVAELLREDGAVSGELVSAAEVASRFNVSRDFVYAHATDLGAIRLGDGPKGRLRFDPVQVADFVDRCHQGSGGKAPDPAPAAAMRRRRSVKSQGRPRSLTVRGEAAR